jgi:hypothetical protein
MSGAVERKARADLRSLPKEYRDSAIGQTYILLAMQLDEGVPARELASVSREMRLCYQQLVDMGGVEKPDSKVDELRRKREERDRGNAVGGD